MAWDHTSRLKVVKELVQSNVFFNVMIDETPSAWGQSAAVGCTFPLLLCQLPAHKIWLWSTCSHFIWDHVRVCHCCHIRPGVWKAVHYHRESKKQFYSQNVFLYRQWCHVSIKIQGALNHRALGEYSFCISIFFWRFNVFLRTCMEQWCPSASNVQLHRRVNKNHHCLPNLADTRERSNPYCDPSCSICRH